MRYAAFAMIATIIPMLDGVILSNRPSAMFGVLLLELFAEAKYKEKDIVKD